MRSVLAVALLVSAQAYATNCTGIIGQIDGIVVVPNIGTVLYAGDDLQAFVYATGGGSMDCGSPSFSSFNTVIDRDLHLSLELGDGRFAQEALQPFRPLTPIFMSQLFSYAEAGNYTLTARGFVNYSFDSVQNIGGENGPIEHTTGTLNFSKTQLVTITSHAPEPATYAMMLAGLGLLAFRRR
jgi:hypothetical protein